MTLSLDKRNNHHYKPGSPTTTHDQSMSDVHQYSRKKWELMTDENGNMYFYNNFTGESTWEIPEEEENTIDEMNQYDEEFDEYDIFVSEQEEERAQMKKYSDMEVSISVINSMHDLLDQVEIKVNQTLKKKKKKIMTLEAEARQKKNLAMSAKRKKREREHATNRYLSILLPIEIKSQENETIAQLKKPVGSLFTQRDSVAWQIDKDLSQISKRYEIRKERKNHCVEVRKRIKEFQMLNIFQKELTNQLIQSQIACSSELQNQKIIVLSMTRHEKEELEIKHIKSFEPAIAEKKMKKKKQKQKQREELMQTIFSLVDESKIGQLNLLHLFFEMSSNEHVRNYAIQIRGLNELLNRNELQRFLIEFASSHATKRKELLVNVKDFQRFIEIIEDVTDHIKAVKEAVGKTEDMIDQAFKVSASSGATGAGGSSVSFVRARMGLIAKTKIAHEIALLKSLEEQVKLAKKSYYNEKFQLKQQQQDKEEENKIDDVYHNEKKEWELHHHHRFIQIEEYLPLYCCLCRRRKWEFHRTQQEELESIFRIDWQNALQLRIKEEELKILHKEEEQKKKKHCDFFNADSTSSSSTQSFSISSPIKALNKQKPLLDESKKVQTKAENCDENIHDDEFLNIIELVESLVTTVEYLMTTSENVEPRQHIKPQKKNSPKKKLQKSKPLTPQQQQQAKKNKFINDEENDPTLSPDEIALKKLIRSLKNEEQERKQMYQEDLALMLLIERSRRAIERPLLKIQETAYASYMRLTENCVAPIPLLFRLQYLRCLSFKFPQQLTLIMRDGGDLANNMYVLQVVPCHGEKEANEIQNQNETLIAKWKSRFSVTLKSSTRHTFQYFADSGMLVECWPVFFNLFEYCPDGLWIFRLVQEFHHAKRPFVELEQRIINGFRDLSSGLASLHAIGLKHLNICVENIYLDTIGTVKIGSTLACKLPFEEQMPLDQVFNHGYVPPEILCQEPATDKADVWMLGSALYHTLLFLQEDQLLVTPKKIFQSKNKIVYMKKIDEILQEIPLSTSDRTRSLLRMLLQPNPKNRPNMNQVFDYFAFTQFATTS